jgi:hypothetical protein
MATLLHLPRAAGPAPVRRSPGVQAAWHATARRSKHAALFGPLTMARLAARPGATSASCTTRKTTVPAQRHVGFRGDQDMRRQPSEPCPAQPCLTIGRQHASIVRETSIIVASVVTGVERRVYRRARQPDSRIRSSGGSPQPGIVRPLHSWLDPRHSRARSRSSHHFIASRRARCRWRGCRTSTSEATISVQRGKSCRIR